jgi:hypothetical protein
MALGPRFSSGAAEPLRAERLAVDDHRQGHAAARPVSDRTADLGPESM